MTGKLLQDGDDEFSFQCDDNVMGRRGGTYDFRFLTIEKYLSKRRGWYEDHEEIITHCRTTESLQTWFLDHWKNPWINKAI